MKLFKIGKVVAKGSNYIVFENNNIGYLVYTVPESEYEIDDSLKLYIYEYENDYQKTMYGFKKFKERLLFQDLIGVTGVGPKSAMSLLSLGEEEIIDAIVEGDTDSLIEAPMIGNKAANQIVIELRNKYSKLSSKKTSSKSNKAIPNKEVSSILKTLGFQKHQIDFAMKNLESKESLDELVQDAIKLISNERFA